ncbi:MAG TPA: O-antigen ligase family protein [Anaeromyxobacteraceae bacterium]|nr:O-antigen ligase family protein [Anaeromyxobacteraceae bacterium]
MAPVLSPNGELHPLGGFARRQGVAIAQHAHAGFRPQLVVAGALAAVTALAVFLSQGDPLLSLVPLLLVGLSVLLWRAPLRVIASLTLFVGLALDADTNGTRDKWSYALEPLRVLFFENLKKVIPVEALKLSVLDLLVLLLVGLVVYRRAVGDRRDGHGVPTVSWLRLGLVLSLLGMVGMLAWGLARGGVFQQAYWQLREPIYVPALALLFLACFKGPRDLGPVGAAVVLAAVYKSLVCIFFYQFIAREFNYKPPYVTSHTDSALFSVAVMIALIAWHEKLSWKVRLCLGASVPVLLLGIYTNNRRLAWVELAFSVMAAYALTPRTFVKRALTRLLVFAAVLAPLYLVVGWNSTSSIFRPVRTVRSVVDADVDRSSLDREVENYNLVVTLKTNPLLGTGLGHEYVEFTKGDDISTVFSQYRFIPHNSVLGILAFGGVFFFTLFWLPLMMGMYLAVRSYRAARTPLARTAALSVVTALIAYEIQGWGDMGIQSWATSFLAAAALGVVAQLAPAVGAWPSRRAAVPSLASPEPFAPAALSPAAAGVGAEAP